MTKGCNIGHSDDTQCVWCMPYDQFVDSFEGMEDVIAAIRDYAPRYFFPPAFEVTEEMVEAAKDEAEVNLAAFEKQQKDKENKPALELIPTGPLMEVAKVFGFGSKKYRADLWRDYPTSVKARLGSALRHIHLALDTEDDDPESGQHHLAHGIVQCMFALAYIRDNPELDDRYHRRNHDKA